MATARPYVVVEIGPSYDGGPSNAFLNHIAHLPYRKIRYVALDPLLQGRPNGFHFTAEENC